MINNTLANYIVKEILKCICYNVSIIDIEGKVVASGCNNCIGLINPYVKKVLETKNFFEIEKASKNVSEGIIFPVFYNDKIICGLKIDGDVNSVRPFGKLIVSLATSLINQDFFIKQYIGSWLNKKNLLSDINLEFEKFVLVFDYRYEYEISLANFIKDILNKGNFKIDVASNRVAILSMIEKRLLNIK
ncbi:sugar diacid recognition domain-containing protein [Clostridium chrysemydis]|uniref:sugar diacid recognition domain-containing protein n=1 Tax=Clostridium chrysemydis TaxID=2665504 RepID=UPI0018845D3F|nr:sugar diacid recognition domain-containing protein [Clostridium chrysemydis]